MELHFVYGGIAAKNFVLPISQSCENESIIFYQMSDVNDIFKMKENNDCLWPELNDFSESYLKL